MLRPLPLRVRQEHAASLSPSRPPGHSTVTALCPLPGGEGRAQPPSCLGPEAHLPAAAIHCQRHHRDTEQDVVRKPHGEKPHWCPVSCALLVPASISSQRRVSSSTRTHGKEGRLVTTGCT
uniref:Uncharacterized protein n=1 Tax=Myotis myotis TaxID=51298 RepID=A0A7J7U5B4_MYOMY|nr:hypothetical protein mMyoMyo1_008817 [Myotis myotis]